MATTRRVTARNRFAKLSLPTNFRVMSVTRQQAVDGCLYDRGRSIEVRITLGQEKDVIPFFDTLLSTIVNSPRGGSIAGDALG